MITMIAYYRLQNLESQLEELETRILKNRMLSRFDLQELEGLSNEIMLTRMRIAGIKV